MNREPIHPYRWAAVALCFIVLGIACFIAIRDNRNAINQISQQKASIKQLQRTNCGLREFLISAKQARIRLYRIDHGRKRRIDRQALRGYKSILRNFPRSSCRR